MNWRPPCVFLCVAVSCALAGLLLADVPAGPMTNSVAGAGGTPAGSSAEASPAGAPVTAPAGEGANAGRGRGVRGTAGAGAPGGRGLQATLGPEPGVHDPVMIKEGDWYYVFRTSGLINVIRSRDFKSWDRVTYRSGDRQVSTVFAEKPAWTSIIQPNRADFWAPDISFHNGKYFLYYSVSTFGSNRSGIGLATNKTLDPASPDFKWEDQGKVIESFNPDFYNCIDPNAFFDKDGTAWLTFGSFYWNQGGGRGGAAANPDAATKGGMMLVQIDPETGKIKEGAKLQSIASRTPPARAIEAPFLIRHGDWYYLFVSWDTCCQGVRSTYRIMVGRSNKITGPYLDKEGKDMLLGGGTQVLAGDGDRIIGPGHQGLMQEGTPGAPDHRWILLYHFYDGHQNGASKLQLRTVSFDTGWPVLGEVINKPQPTAPSTGSRRGAGGM